MPANRPGGDKTPAIGVGQGVVAPAGVASVLLLAWLV